MTTEKIDGSDPAPESKDAAIPAAIAKDDELRSFVMKALADAAIASNERSARLTERVALLEGQQFPEGSTAASPTNSYKDDGMPISQHLSSKVSSSFHWDLSSRSIQSAPSNRARSNDGPNLSDRILLIEENLRAKRKLDEEGKRKLKEKKRKLDK